MPLSDLQYRIEPSADELAKLERLLRTMPGLSKALVHTSASASDPYVKDGAPPSMVLQLYFPEVEDSKPRCHELAISAPLTRTPNFRRSA